ncbi:2-carboxy-1,4-naphthoquinone phytyltransferase, chloroplastic isoform X3 [Prunus dulcis]|uniref:2-carboxy-1,4-naphthoquinone phytyltransferase, chloroplastic isoform X3 n=1 Tax=Prunus dulcis TaxID=3755 RepID=UPI0014830C62|nr:2-carboxy-1,4-naphthoquinone phytyltransferase, chloroplastic isoform X3 [Prunus dulcis]
MATTFCNLNTGFGLTKPNEYHLKQIVSKRSYGGYGTLSCFSCNAKRVFHRVCRRELEAKQWQYCGQAFVNNKADYSNTIREENKEVDISKATLIWRAIKLPIYSVALVPLTVGSAAAYLQTGMFSAWHYSVLLVSSVLIITWLNLSNDVYDFDTGADKDKKESVVNLVGSRTGTLVAAYLLLALGFLGLAWVSFEAGNMRAILLLACAIMCGYIYQIEGDKAVGKMSPLVRLGTKRGLVVVKLAIIGLYVLTFTFGLSSALPFTCIFLCALTLPIARLVVSYVEENHNDKHKIFMAKYYCVRLHSLFGAALAAGLVLPRMVPKINIAREGRRLSF